MGKFIVGDFTLELDSGDDMYEMNLYDLLNIALYAEKKVVKEIVKVRDELFLVMGITSEGRCKDPTPNLTVQKVPSLSSFWGGYFWMVVCTVCRTHGRNQNKRIM